MQKYRRWYDQLIEHARNRPAPDGVYFEIHHILPRALGGGDEPSNTVELTYREHFLAHWLLSKVVEGKARRSMVFALHAMTFDSVGKRVAAAWRYEVAKRALRQLVAMRVTARYEARKAKARAAREQSIFAGQVVPEKAMGLRLRKGLDRRQVHALTADILKASPARLNYRQRRRQESSNARDKRILAEAKRTLGLPYSRGRSRPGKRTRQAIKAGDQAPP